MFELIQQVIAVGFDSKYLISGLAIACAMVFYHMTDSRLLTVLFAPVAAFGAMLGIYASREFGVYFSADQDSNVIAGGILGVVLGVGIVLIAARIGYNFTSTYRGWQARCLRSESR